MSYVIRVRYNGNTNLVGPFNQRVLADNWVSVAQAYLEEQWGERYQSASFKVIRLMAPYKTRTVSVLNTLEDGE